MDAKTLSGLNQVAPLSAVSSSNKVVITTNPTNKTMFSWVHSSVSFPKGELLEANISTMGALARPSSSRVLKRWEDGSVCLLALKMPYLLPPGGVAIDEIGVRPNPAGSFQWEPNLINWINSGGLLNDFLVRCTSQGQVLVANPFQGVSKLLYANETGLAYRFRSHFMTTAMPSVSKELSCTVYAEVEHLSPMIKMTVVIGSDTLEKPIPGGSDVTNFEVISSKPGMIQNDASYQSHSCFLADGQQVAFRYFLCTSPDQVFLDTMAAWSQCEFVGLQSYEQHQASRGLMTHFELPNPRFQPSELSNVHALIDSQNATPLYATPKTNIWGINLNPGSTGDQGDFGSGHPMTKCLQSYSLNLFNRHFVGVYRESFRPSHFWNTGPNGLDYCSLAPFINLFFWTGRPHWDPTWNPEPENAVWRARGAMAPGDFGGWNGADNQHCSNNNLRAVYELSGDFYLSDICHSYCSVFYWDFFTKWAGATEAERCCRMMKESYAMADLFSHTPEGQILMQAVLLKAGVFDTEVTSNITQYNVPAVAPFWSCDPRVNNGVWCTPYPGNTIAVAWQTGFHQEWEFTRSQYPGMNPDLRYLDYAHTYFANDGGAKTYFPLPNPPDATYGGIGLAWWSGWVMLAKKYPTHVNAPFILNQVKAMVDQDIESQVQGYFSGNDRWKCWA